VTNFSVSGRNDPTRFDGFGETFGRNDQYLTL